METHITLLIHLASYVVNCIFIHFPYCYQCIFITKGVLKCTQVKTYT